MVLRSGKAPRQSLLFPYTPVVEGRRPVRIETLDGLQAGEGQYALVKSIPFSANRFKLGVLIGDFGSSNEIQSFISSIAIKMTLGRSRACVKLTVPRKKSK